MNGKLFIVLFAVLTFVLANDNLELPNDDLAPSSSKCSSGTYCYNGQWLSCCPHPGGICCSMYTCCPRGYQCDLTGNYCYRFNQASDSNPFSDALSMMKSYEEIKAEKLQKIAILPAK
ncbi:progranulin-like [Artemia franciscana]